MENDKLDLTELLHGMKFIEKTYDVMRIVDPIKKRVFNYRKNRLIENDLVCYHFWRKNNSCDNCISVRAYQENKVFYKLEYRKGKIYMLQAIPIKIGEMTVIAELFKEVSKNILIVTRDAELEYDVHNMIINDSNLLLKDPLTEVFNRRYIDERLPADIIDNNLHQSALSLIMADIDFFKTVNDTYGHLAGDFILKEIANIFISCIRNAQDWVARFGGEEFLIGLPNTDKAEASEIAERMRVKIENTAFEYEGKMIKLTTSFGVYTLVHNAESNLESIINFADQNLYKAKKSGRNQVVSS